MNSNKFRKTKGFTLVELLVVISILAILAGITIITYTGFIKQSANSSDMVLVNQLNTLLKSQRVFGDVDSDNDLAILLQNYFGNDVNIASQKYDMDIYYSNETQEFELLDNESAQNNKSLTYYLSCLTFHINKENKSYSKIIDIDANEIDLKSYFVKDTMYLDISSENTTHSVDLNNIIKAYDSDGNQIENISYSVIDIFDIFEADKTKFTIEDSKLIVNTPGKYQINYECQGVQGTLDLMVRNVYYSKSANITLDGSIKYKYNLYNGEISLEISSYKGVIKIADYDSNDTPMALHLSEIIEDINIAISIEVNGETILRKIDTTQSTITIDSIKANSGDEIKIKYIYQGRNGEYVCSEEKIITVK